MVVSSTTISCANAITISATVRLRGLDICDSPFPFQARATAGVMVVGSDQSAGARRMRRYSVIPTSRNCSSSWRGKAGAAAA
jgi:hypothetical protein